MPSQYLKCETCPEVYDRRPAPSMGGFNQQGTYRWSESAELIRDAKAAGWTIVGDNRHLCPKCTPPVMRNA